MAFPCSKDRQDQHIDETDCTPYEWNDSKETAAQGIRNGPKGRLKSLLVTTYNHEREVGQNTAEKDEECHYQW